MNLVNTTGLYQYYRHNLKSTRKWFMTKHTVLSAQSIAHLIWIPQKVGYLFLITVVLEFGISLKKLISVRLEVSFSRFSTYSIAFLIK